jgi:hypothetical protein
MTAPATAAPATVTVKTTSHRSRERLLRLTGPLQSYFSWTADGAFYYVPAEHAQAAAAIKGVTVLARTRTDLNRTLSFR